MESEVARLRRQIEAEYTSAHRALHGFAIVAKHEFITKRLENVGVLHQQLAAIVGDKEAIETVFAIAEEVQRG